MLARKQVILIQLLDIISMVVFLGDDATDAIPNRFLVHMQLISTQCNILIQKPLYAIIIMV